MHMNNIKQEWEWFVAKFTSVASAQSARGKLRWHVLPVWSRFLM